MNHGTRADAERLKAEITSQQRLLDGLDRAIGSLYESRQVGVSRLFDLQAQLANITDRHYAQMVTEAQALAREAS